MPLTRTGLVSRDPGPGSRIRIASSGTLADSGFSVGSGAGAGVSVGGGGTLVSVGSMGSSVPGEGKLHPPRMTAQTSATMVANLRIMSTLQTSQV